MVFRKSGMKGKQQTPAKQKGKKAAEEDSETFFDMNSEDDSESEQKMVKTPGKTPKGKQSQRDQRVSFQKPGKNTPGNKTPKSENSIVGKKQQTPGKTALKEFIGLQANSSKKNGKPTKRSAEDDSDDDDDDDDDDEDDADLDMLLGGGDDDDDDDDDDNNEEEGDDDDDDDDNNEEEGDDDDDEDDDDDDDDDDEEDSLPTKKQNANQKQQIKKEATAGQKKTSKKEEPKSIDKTPKGADKTKNIQVIKGDKMQKAAESPARVSPKKNEKKEASENRLAEMSSMGIGNKPCLDIKPSEDQISDRSISIHQLARDFQKAAIELGNERKRERDAKTLFIGNLPEGVSAAELKTLSSDILSVNIPPANNKRKHHLFAFVEFLNEAKAEENYKNLIGKKLRGVPISMDFTGHKRQNVYQKLSSDQSTINMKKLHISSLSLDVTIDKIAQLFPKAFQIFLNTSPVYRCATVIFTNEKDGAEALETSKSAKIDGTPITAIYSIDRSTANKRKRRTPIHSSSKKMKFSGKQESNDDE